MKPQNGFTLIEILVALAIFSLVSTLTSAILYQTFTTHRRLTGQISQLNQIQSALTLVNRDIQQMIERSVYGNEMHFFPPFVGQGHYLEFTRDGETNLQDLLNQSALKRIAFLCKNKQLVRRAWEQVDTPNRNAYQDRVLLENVQCSFAYLAHNHQILPTWQAYAVQQNQKNETLPLAIQFNLEFPSQGKMNLLWIIPGALYG